MSTKTEVRQGNLFRRLKISQSAKRREAAERAAKALMQLHPKEETELETLGYTNVVEDLQMLRTIALDRVASKTLTLRSKHIAKAELKYIDVALNKVLEAAPV